MYSVLRNVEILRVWNCHNLINLMPFSASLENLTTLNIQCCHRLINLITPSTARSLVQLTKMSIDGCKMITEIVANEGDATRNDIILSKLKWLLLHRLPRLTSFCSRNYAFEFPSLEQLIVNESPGMEIFSRGVSSTPRLWKMQLSVDGNDECWDGDVNTTIQRIHRTSAHHQSTAADVADVTYTSLNIDDVPLDLPAYFTDVHGHSSKLYGETALFFRLCCSALALLQFDIAAQIVELSLSMREIFLLSSKLNVQSSKED
ncbi:hypothetical protein EZV62_006990 [Acer yangbiense]|uniref:Disease resistance protein At4g27190-like leucine-rich repeats domain-containing protein n=1 Tax=Acer yangbiense TaxID=1000413 RepID=A0A5C7I911_9ROSI|nr:hypothetical protein EZV62_006990 [Acer yangbiense]